MPESWDSPCDEAREIFRTLLRFDTTNPPGNEGEAAAFVREIFDKAGIDVTVVESAPGRPNLVARLAGDGSKEPLLLHGHLDVVAVEPDKWSVDPFAAEIKDGCIFGRGAVDMKNFVAQSIMTLLLLKREAKKLSRDIIVACVADEENGCNFGSKWLVDNHPELVRAEYAIGEGGGFEMHVADQTVFPVMIAEKGVCWLKITASGTPGHGSVPHGDMAAVKIARAAHILGTKRLPLHVPEATRKMVKALAGLQGGVKSIVLSQVLNPLLSDMILNRVIPDKYQAAGIAAMLHNTISPTILRAGEKTNVIPSEAVIEVDGRTLPGQSQEDFLAEVRAAIGDGYEIEVTNYGDPMEVPYDDPFVDLVRDLMKRRRPDADVIPFVLPGFTDAKHFRRLGTKTYGFAPLLLPPDASYSTLAHGHDERISIEAFDFGVKTLYELVCEFGN